LGVRRHRVQHAAKRVVDPLAALTGLIVLSPVFLAVAVAVIVDSGRPVLFVSRRAGKGGKPFRMLKIRTMVPGAIELGRELGLTEDPFGMVQNDPRVTGVGRWLRRTSLDELPQLVNVLKGEMSLVGPRADLVEQVENYAPEDRVRLSVLPGITGWAQVHGRDSIPWPERFRLDREYVENWSLWLDARILGLTVLELFRDEPEPIEDTMNIERARAKSAQRS
jgi:lipopolysaccharide/colanic/teichoic acid biosynthesis glycosyltransferase